MKKRGFLWVPALLLCLSASGCGGSDNGGTEEEYRAPEVVQEAAYDSAAAYEDYYDDYLGVWEGGEDATCATLEISAIESGLYFIFSDDNDELVASGNAQNMPEYGYIYFFNEMDGNAYQTAGDASGLQIAEFGSYALTSPAVKASAKFEGIAETWYLDGDLDADSSIEIAANGEWTLYETDENGFSMIIDYGYLEQDPAVEEQFYAHSRQFEDVSYDLHMTLSQEAFWWGEQGDAYIRESLSE